MEIQKVITKIKFDAVEDPEYELFSEENIIKALSYEDAVPNAKEMLPEDYKWYMSNLGCINVRNAEYQVQIDGATCLIIAFDGLIDPQTACTSYRYETCTGAYAYRLEDFSENDYILGTEFLPITSNYDGKMLAMDIKNKKGNIYQFIAKEDCKTHDLEYKPILIADSFTAFLKTVKPIYSFQNKLKNDGYKEVEQGSNIWKKNIQTAKEIFYKCIVEYENNSPQKFIEFIDVNTFLTLLTNTPENILINEPRAVELFYLSYGGAWKVKNTFEVKENIEKIQKLKSNLSQKREKYTIEGLEQYTSTDYSSIATNHNFYRTTVKSISNDLQCEEDFVFYKNPNTQMLSLVKRVQIRIEDLTINGVATFEYDSSWSSKKAKKTAWSEIPATIHLNHNVEDFTIAYYDFIRKTISDISFKEKLEKFIFNHYQENDYPEFLEMTPTDKEHFGDFYPKISSPHEIWRVLGAHFGIYFTGNQTFELQFEYGPDDEHGLSLSVSNERIRLN